MDVIFFFLTTSVYTHILWVTDLGIDVILASIQRLKPLTPRNNLKLSTHREPTCHTRKRALLQNNTG